jgi:phospholipid/cholesterol/gamma-HCH transport system substrate-binding protein
MKAGAILETVLGVAVLAAAAAFLIFGQSQLEAGPGRDSYPLTARFSSVGDLARGAEVRVAGVPVGSVQSVRLDPQTYFARIEMRLRADVLLPLDSTAKVTSSGLLGGSYIEIEPGGDMDMLASGDEIEFTQGAVDIFDLIGEFMSGRQSGS